jgi:PBP1b-binding outer membrane lipoprotein LpoB
MKKTTILAVLAFVALAFTACSNGTTENTEASTDSTAVTVDSTLSADTATVDSAVTPVN